MGRIRFLLEVWTSFAISIAFLTGLLYLTTRNLTDDPSWPDPRFVWGGIVGAGLGLLVLTWASGADPGARESSPRFRMPRRSWLVGGLIAFVIWSTVYTTMTTGHGGPAYPSDMILGGIRNAIREAWAALTGQPPSRDLFPF